MILTQSESWADMRVNDALKRDSNDSTSDTDAAINDTRLSKPKVQVSLVSPDSMKRKVADAIRASLSKSKTETFHRKPIMVCAKTGEQAKDLTDYLKDELRSDDVNKILCLAQYSDIDEFYNDLGKQTVYVISDAVLKTSFNIGHSVIPLVINYGMPDSLPELLSRVSKARQGFSASHMTKHGSVECRVTFIIPLG